MRTLVLFALLACRGDEDPLPHGDPEVILSDAAVILDDATARNVRSLSADVRTLVFDGTTPLLDAVQVGDVLVAGVSEALPAGLLREVLAIERDGDLTTVTAGPAGLTDVVEKGHLQAVLDLSEEARAERLGPDAIVVGFNQRVVFDGDDDEGTTDDQVRVDGSISIDPELVIDIDISGFSLQTATVELQADLDAYLTIDADRHALVDERIPLQTIEFRPVTLLLGPLPVVFLPELELAIDLDGTVTARMTDTLEVETFAAAGFGYDGGSFGPIFDLDPSGDLDVGVFEPGGTATMKVALDARFDVAAYGMAGVYVGLGPYARMEVDTLGNPWWSVYGGVEGYAGAYARIDIDFLFIDETIEIFDYATAPLGHEVLVAQAQGVAPPLEDVVEEVGWARTYGGDAAEHPVGLHALDDGGLMMVGGTLSASPLPEDALAMRLDRLGNVAWTVVFDDLGPGISVVGQGDGFVMAAGPVGTSTGVPTLIGLDPNGVPVWMQQLTAEADLAVHQLVESADGGFFAVGAHGSFDATDAWVARFFADGTLDWSQTLGGPRADRALAVAASPSGGIWVAADTDSFGTTFGGMWVAELDATGAVLWQRLIDGDGLEAPRQIVPMPSGDLVVVGDDGTHALVVRLTGGGDLVWARTVDSGADATTAVGAALADTDRVLVGGKVGLGADSDVWAFRMDDGGQVDWARSYGGPLTDTLGGTSAYAYVGMPLVPCVEGGFFLAATSDSFASGGTDVWALRIGETGFLDFDLDPGARNLNIGATVDDLEVDHLPGNAVAAPLPLDLTAVSIERHSLWVGVAEQAAP